MVTTPVPPTPVTRMLYGSSSATVEGVGNAHTSSALAASALGLRKEPPSTVTKLGQKPLRQVKSLLHEDWSISRLRPYSVSTATTDMQLDLLLQSPQPSHTASLITTRRAGSGNLPRLRRRRFSAAQVWS
ncbi:hypothetical protein D3C85_1529640 [compost metagenome]